MINLPTCKQYSNYLATATERFGITIDECRNKYGLYSQEQWNELLTKNKQL